MLALQLGEVEALRPDEQIDDGRGIGDFSPLVSPFDLKEATAVIV